MKIVILGKKTANKIKNVLEKTQDGTSITVYSNINDFVTDYNLRKKNAAEIDRFIVLQDTFNEIKEEELDSLLNTFNNYLCKYHPSSKVISLIKNTSILDHITNRLFSPTMLHIHIKEAINYNDIINIATLNINVLSKKYENTLESFSSGKDILEEDVSSPDSHTVEMKNNNEYPKKKLFGLFGRNSKNKKNISKVNTTLSPIGQITDLEKIPTENNVAIVEKNSDVLNKNEFEQENIPLPSVSNEDDIQIESIEQTISKNNLVEDLIIKSDDLKSESSVEEACEVETEFDNMHYEFKENIQIDNVDKELEELNEFAINARNAGNIIDVAIDNKSINNSNINNIENNLEEVDTLSDDLGDISSMVEKFEEAKKPKVIEKKEIIEKIITVKGRNISNDGIRIIVVTGDRRSHITTTALKLAKYFSETSQVLYVDFDIKNKGLLSHLGLYDLLCSDPVVQQGVKNLKKSINLTKLTYKTKFGFDSLLSAYDVDVTEEDISRVQSILTIQKYYKTLIIDCPISYIKNLKEILFQSEVLICCDNNDSGRINTLISLSSLNSSPVASSIYRGKYIISNGTNSEFSRHMNYLREIFCLADESVAYDEDNLSISTSYDWSSLEFINIADSINPLIETL
ncbi:hypothetical protein QEW_4637 [Clostridioides difficile CD160]|nr:hypothetical protein QEW_4637 [Clostridioides difficile CD160]